MRWAALGLLGVFASSAAVAAPQSGTQPLRLTAYKDTAAVRAGLVEAGKKRVRRAGHHGELDSFTSMQVSAANGISLGANEIAIGNDVWIDRSTSVAKASIGGALPARAERIALPAGVAATRLVAAAEGPLAITRSRADCGISAEPFSVGPLDALDAVSVCGRSAGSADVAAVGRRVVVFATLDAVTDVFVPMVQLGNGPPQFIDKLGPVYQPLQATPDVVIHLVLVCDAKVASCRASSFVTPRGPRGAVWFDDKRLVFAYGQPDGLSTAIAVPYDGTPPAATPLGIAAHEIHGLADGTLVVVGSTTSTNGAPAMTSVDSALASGSVTTFAAPAKDDRGGWTWAVAGNSVLLGAPRTSNCCSEPSTLQIAPARGGAIESVPITVSADAIHVVGNDVYIAGADKDRGTLLTRAIGATGPWKSLPYEPVKAKGDYGGGWSVPRDSRIAAIDKRRIFISATGDREDRFELYDVLPTEVKKLAGARRSSPPPAEILYDRNQLAVAIVGKRIVVMLENEIVIYELTSASAREVGRIMFSR